MIKIAIAGNIASGKSEAGKYLSSMDYVVLDTDVMTHDILIDKPDAAIAFKDYDIFEFGRLSREKLGKLVFSNPDLKQKLEDIVHPLILNEIETAFKTFEGEKAVFVLVPLLFEAGWEKLFDKIIFVAADDEIRLKRLIKRNNLSKSDALLRLSSQNSQDEKIKKSDFVIYNNSTLDELRKNIDKALKTL